MNPRITFLAAIILLLCMSTAYSQGLKVMSFNIRFDNPADGLNSWGNRKDFVVQMLGHESPDLIGMQEVLERQASYIKNNLEGFDYVGVGRDDGKTAGEYSPVFYNTERFKVLEWGTFWLSPAPEDTGSVGWDAALTRICTWIKFQDNHADRSFYFLNTHFDHVGSIARKESSRKILDFIHINALGFPVVLTGDFNCIPEDGAYEVLTNPDDGLEDACLHSAFPEVCDQGTFNGFGSSEESARIDLILFKGDWEVESFEILKLREGELFISDHWPVLARARSLQ